MKALAVVVAILLLMGALGRAQMAAAAGSTQGSPTTGSTQPQTVSPQLALEECLGQEAADQAAHDQVRQTVLQLSTQKTQDDQTIEQEMKSYYVQAARDDQSIRTDRVRVQTDEAAVARDQHDIDAFRGHSNLQGLEQQLAALKTQSDQDAQALAQDQTRIQADEARVQQDQQAMKQLEQQRASTYRTYDMQARTVSMQTSQSAGQISGNSAVVQQRTQRENDDRAYDQQMQGLRAQYARDTQTLQQDHARVSADDARVHHDQQAIDALNRQVDYERRADDRMNQLQARLATHTNALTQDRASLRADYADMGQATQTLEKFRQQRTADDQSIDRQLEALRPQYASTWYALQRIQASCAKLKTAAK
jgi:hypothetical protein